MRWRMFAVLTVWLPAAGGLALAAAAEPPLPGRGPYLGQKPPGMTAEVFAPGLVSSSSFEHSRLEISKDGTTLYWAVQPLRGRQSIWTTHRGADGSWSMPAELPLSNGAEALPFLSSPTLAPDGKRLYFTSLDRSTNRQTLYAVDLANPRWDAATPVPAWFPDIGEVWVFSFAANGNLFFDSGGKLFTMELRNGGYGAPVKLGSGINDGEFDALPFIAPDESYLLFCSARGGSASLDLYVSFRGSDGGWGPPRDLGPKVNTSANERFPSASPDGRYLFFLRNGLERGSDSSFYWIDAVVIEEARPPAQ